VLGADIESDRGPANVRKRDFNFDLSNFRENSSIESPLRDGIVTDWELLEKLWTRAMTTYISGDLRETPVLLAEKPYTLLESRKRLRGAFCWK
jgi:actin-related protein